MILRSYKRCKHIISFIPMYFVTGMMGPYMRPMPLNVPLAMLMSLVVPSRSPWATFHLLKHEYGKEKPFVLEETWIYRTYSASCRPAGPALGGRPSCSSLWAALHLRAPARGGPGALEDAPLTTRTSSVVTDLPTTLPQRTEGG
jgi:hypothetical protein